MSEAGYEGPGASPTSVGREFMDLDLDLDDASWPLFDHTAAFVSSPPPPFILSSSPPQSLMQFSFPPPPSPLWPFEDRDAEISSSLADYPKLIHGYSDTTNGNINSDDDRTRLLQIPAAEDNFNRSYVIKERIGQALRYFKESTDQHILVQVWAPVKNVDRYVLTTSGQPFVLPQSTKLLKYRMVSMSYMFPVDEDSDVGLGLPGRVFKQKLPEWTPNVQYYSIKEYPRLNHALHYDVQGSLALPVFEPSGQSCVGVVELIMTSEKIHYAREVDKVCKALEAVNLKSSEILGHPNVQICNEGRQTALAEILEILTVVCEAHKLPLAQTWVPCRHRSVLAHGGGLKKSCYSFDGRCMGKVCMSTTDVAYYVIDSHMWGFRDACAEHHLQKGQGVAGMAFESRRPCFCADITQFCKDEYPLVHYARMFGLASCLAICLQSTQSGDDDYILEFFLPPECKDTSDQQAMLDSISILMKQCFRSLKVINGLHLLEGITLEIIDMRANDNHEPKRKPLCSQSHETQVHTSPETNTPVVLDGSQDEEDAIPDSREEHLVTDANAEKNGSGMCSPVLGSKSNGILQRRRGKAEKSISLEVLQRYFAGSLKDAARSLGVCPTTMKRICRQHGITRWPSRKINKVNRSLSKLKRVMESVQGAEGAFNLTSLPSTLLVADDSTFLPVNLDGPTWSKRAPKDTDSSLKMTAESDGLQSKVIVFNEPVRDQTSSQPEPEKESDCSKTRSSSEGNADGSGQGKETHLVNPFSSPGLEENGTDICRFFGFSSQLACSMPATITADPEPPLLRGMLIEDSGSSKDLRDLWYSIGDNCHDECPMDLAQKDSQPTATQEPRAVTVKACYKEDIIRFRIPCNAGMVALNDEVAKRLKLEVGTFDLKYLDDDHECVILACDGDLEERMEMSSSSGAHLIRLTVHDVAANLGSSSGSS